MKRILPFLLCLILSVFAMARSTKPAHMPAPDRTTAQKNPAREQADAKRLLKDANTDEEVSSDDDDSMEGASGDEGQDINDGDGGNASGDEGTGADGEGDDDGGGDAGDDQGE